MRPFVVLAALALSPAALAAPYVGQQDLVVLTVQVDPEPTYGSAAFLADVEATLDELADVLHINSAGAVQVSYSILDPITVSSSLCVGTNTEIQEALLAEAVLARDGEFDGASTHQIVLVVDASPNCSPGASGHDRQVWPIPTLGGGLLDSAVAVTVDPHGTQPRSANAVHELAHTFGGEHNEPWVCVENGARVPLDHHFTWQTCTLSWPPFTFLDPMSGNWYDFSGPQKVHFEWIAPSEVATVSSGTVWLSPTESLPEEGHVRAVRVPLSNSYYHSYLLELRTATEPVTPLPSTWPTPAPALGVYLWADRSWAESAVAEPVEVPPFASETAYTPGPMPVGVTYVDAEMGLGITVLAASAKGALIDVYPLPGSPPPPPPQCIGKLCYTLPPFEPPIDRMK